MLIKALTEYLFHWLHQKQYNNNFENYFKDLLEHEAPYFFGWRYHLELQRIHIDGSYWKNADMVVSCLSVNELKKQFNHFVVY